MGAAEFETAQEAEAAVFCWRLSELLDAGYEYEDALALSSDTEVDLHLAIDLPQRGCPHPTALRILL
jgi:hypothetical protein